MVRHVQEQRVIWVMLAHDLAHALRVLVGGVVADDVTLHRHVVPEVESGSEILLKVVLMWAVKPVRGIIFAPLYYCALQQHKHSHKPHS